ncbi:hypothetical protein FEM08_26730 [Flavobacterium gilvum]|nr:hypothetical protein FEM08_26730 [Flavobacterium gilvum]
MTTLFFIKKTSSVFGKKLVFSSFSPDKNDLRFLINDI